MRLVKENKYKGFLKTKLLKKVLALGVVGTMLFSFTGCGNDEIVSHSNDNNIILSAETLEFTQLDFSCIETGFDNDVYEFKYKEGSQISEPVYFPYYNHINGGYDNENSKTDGYVVEKNIDGKKVIVDASNHETVVCSDYDTIYKPVYVKRNGQKIYFIQIKNNDGSKRLVDANDMNNILLDSYESISVPSLCEGFSSVDSNKWVREVILTSGEKLLIDNNDFKNVLCSGYDSISSSYINEYFSVQNGGTDAGGREGEFRQIIKSDGTKMLVSTDDINKVLISGYDCCSKTFYLEYYDAANGGKDNNPNGGNGHVWEFVINGEKVLYDANDLSKELIRGYETITSNQSGIVVTYKDGTTEVIRASNFPGFLEEETTTEKKEETTTEIDVDNTTISTTFKTLDEIKAERGYATYHESVIFNDKEYFVCRVEDSGFKVLINSETFKEIIPEGEYINFITDHSSYLYGISKDGNVDRIKIAEKENVIVGTLLENTNYRFGYHTRIPSKLQSNETDFISYLILSSDYDVSNGAYLNLDTNNIEIQENVYNRVEAYASNCYFLGITNNGDLYAIKKGETAPTIISIAKDTGYNSVSWKLDNDGDLYYDSRIFESVLLYNEEEGREFGEFYMINDDFELKQVERSKVKTK